MNAARRAGHRATASGLAAERGAAVSSHEVKEVLEKSGGYDWWPWDVYRASHWGADPSKHGHVKMKRHGKDGVAVFHKPAGVVSVEP
eukprot:3534008-Alexandrium_andersonii.AAC.1